jgi:hypothetical protein
MCLDWHALLLPIRRAAVAQAGRLVIYRKGKPADPDDSSIAMIRSDARRPPARCAQRTHPNRWHFEPAPIALDRAS